MGEGLVWLVASQFTLPPLSHSYVGAIMSYQGSYRGQVVWEKTDFTKHGYIATYLLGECRCDKCVKAWENWDPFPVRVYYRSMI